jgi:hypothetical protein
MSEQGVQAAPIGRRTQTLLVVLAYVVMTLAATWPLALHIETHNVVNHDVYGNIWALAWVAHQLEADPLHLFDANMYHPHKLMLAMGESHLPQALIAAVFMKTGISALAAYNIVFLLSFFLSAFGLYLLARELGLGTTGAFLAGLGFGFCAYRYKHIVHLQSLSTQWLPLALLFLVRFLRRPRKRDAVLSVGFTIAQALSSGYFAMLMVPVLGAVLVWGWRALLNRAALARLGVAAAVGLALLLVVTWPHRKVAAQYHLTRSRAESLHWSASLGSYLDPGPYAGLPHQRFLHRRFASGQNLAPSVTILGLALLALVVVRRERATRLAAAITLIGVLLSLGPELSVGVATIPGPYELLRLLPGGRLMRTPGRMGIGALLGLALLAGAGWTWLERRLGRYSTAAGMAVALLVAVEVLPCGLRYAILPLAPRPQATEWLVRAARGPVLELPWDQWSGNARYLYWSTAHWLPMLNGFASFEVRAEPNNARLGMIANRWPTPYAVRQLRLRAVRYVVLHADLLTPGQQGYFARTPTPAGVRVAARFGEDYVFEIEPLASE